MTPGQKEHLSLRLEQLFREIGELMMDDVIRRIKKTGGITSTADYQINRLMLLGATSEEIEREIQKRLNLSYEQLYKMYDDVIDWEYVRNKDIYEQINSNFIPYEENYELQQLSKSLIDQTKDTLKNFTASTGFMISDGQNMQIVTMQDYYQKHLDKAMLSIVTGAIDYDTALRKCVTEMTNSGIRIVDYASGHHNRIDVAAIRAVMTGISQLSGKISDYNAEKLGINTFEVAWHAGARNTGNGYFNHQSWQGRVYSKEELTTICGLGQGGGLLGWNCYHEYYPFFPGLSQRNWPDEWLDNMNESENIPKEYNGKWYDMYAATQQQRHMETAMRAQREKVRLLQKGDANEETIQNARIRYNGQLYEYVKFSNQMHLKQQRARIYLDGRGRVAVDNATAKRAAAKKAENTRQSRFNDRFSTLNNGQKDIITYRRLHNNLAKSEIGQETIDYILEHPELNIRMCYKTDPSLNIYGQQIDDDIYIYASETKTVQKTAEILIHEITHHRYDIGGSQWSECVCRAQEIKHRAQKNELTSGEMRVILKEVKLLYPNLPWR